MASYQSTRYYDSAAKKDCLYTFTETSTIVQEATVPQKLLCGLLRVVKNLIPIVGTLIPDETIINLFAKYIAPAFGMDLEEFNAQREEAKQTVEQYNKENN